MGKEKSWTVGELIILLETLPSLKKVILHDADTGYTIPEFSIHEDKEWVMFYPCSYEKMT